MTRDAVGYPGKGEAAREARLSPGSPTSHVIAEIGKPQPHRLDRRNRAGSPESETKPTAEGGRPPHPRKTGADLGTPGCHTGIAGDGSDKSFGIIVGVVE